MECEHREDHDMTEEGRMPKRRSRGLVKQPSRDSNGRSADLAPITPTPSLKAGMSARRSSDGGNQPIRGMKGRGRNWAIVFQLDVVLLGARFYYPARNTGHPFFKEGEVGAQ